MGKISWQELEKRALESDDPAWHKVVHDSRAHRKSAKRQAIISFIVWGILMILGFLVLTSAVAIVLRFWWTILS